MTSAATGQTQPADLLDANAGVSTEDRQLQDAVTHFARQRLRPGIADWFEAGHFPAELAHEFGDLGVLGMHLKGYGCAGASATSYGLACLELEAADSAFRSFVSVQGSLSMFSIWAHGSEEQKEEWLPRLASGREVGCFGLTEPDAGSDPGSMRTHAERRGGDWILSGARMWSTNGSRADVTTVWARTEEGVRGFLVPRGTPGFAALDIRQKLSLRASVTSELTFDSVRLPDSARLPLAEGLRAPLSACPRPGSGSCSARSARPATAWSPPWPTPPRGPSSAARSPGSSSPSRNWPT
jgi:glutaryl-CoA dehydrogenase